MGGLDNPKIPHCPIPNVHVVLGSIWGGGGLDNPNCPISQCTCSTGEVQERVRVLQEKLRQVEGELEEGQEERSVKYAELRSKEQAITGEP